MGDMGGEWTSKARDEKARVMSWWNCWWRILQMLANSASSGVSAQIKDGAASGAGSRLVPGASGGSSAARGSDVGPVWVPMVLEVLVQVPRWFCVAAEVLVWFQRVQSMVPCRRRQLES